jgi:DNA polymerase-3 subunit delta
MVYDALLKDLKAGKFKPCYLLMGDEPYFIDVVADYFENNIIPEDFRDFNLSILYGGDSSGDQVVVAAKRYPMMSDIQLVIVKEAQMMRDFSLVEEYLKKPLSSTILVIIFKHKAPDKRKAWLNRVKEHGVIFESKRIKDEEVAGWVTNYLRSSGYTIDPHAAALVSESVGNDIEKIVNELGKLMLNFKPGYTIATADVEKFVGVSREYSVFELQKALSTKNLVKTNKIVFHMADNPKNFAMPMVIASLFTYFSKILHLHGLGAKPRSEKASIAGVPVFFMQEYEMAMNHYSPAKLIHIMHHLRAYDMKSKGFDNGIAADGELLKELIYKITH